jgi:predicted Fe-Mo cluster-binding NifX family protein
MLIAVTAKTADVDSEVDPRFGRAAFFHIIDTETHSMKVIENSQNVNAVQGAGIQAAQIVVDNKIEVLLTGHCGPKAFQVLNSAGVKIVVGIDGRVKNIIELFKNDKFEYAVSPDVEPHW